MYLPRLYKEEEAENNPERGDGYHQESVLHIFQFLPATQSGI